MLQGIGSVLCCRGTPSDAIRRTTQQTCSIAAIWSTVCQPDVVWLTVRLVVWMRGAESNVGKQAALWALGAVVHVRLLHLGLQLVLLLLASYTAGWCLLVTCLDSVKW